MHCHPLVEVAYILHEVCSTIVHGERGLGESLRKSPSLNSMHERWSGDLVERSAHRVISQALGRWIPVSALMVVVFNIRERLIRRSFWSASITSILFIMGREVWIWGSSLSLFVAQLSLQMINLQLQSSSILFMRKVAPISGLAPASMGGMHTNLPVPSSLKVDKLVFTLGSHRFCLVWTWTYYSWTSNSLKHQEFPTNSVNCKDQIWVPSPKRWMNLSPKSPIQWICREWVGKPGFSELENK